MSTLTGPLLTDEFRSLQAEDLEVVDNPVDKWAAIAGRWKFKEDGVEFEGPDEPQNRLPLGLARTSGRFRDGTIRTKIRLTRLEKTAAGVFFGFKSTDSSYFAAQIGAFDSAYAISEHRPDVGWLSIARAGLLSNLSTDRAHDLRATVSGQSIRLSVDDVEVVSAIASRPIDGTGFGLFAWGDARIEFSGTRLLSAAPKLFVIMPFAEPFDTLYREVIFPVTSKLNFRVVRVDEIAGPGIILEDIQRQVENSQAVVAEISTHNPNVFYELGYAHALRKPAILLVRRQEGQSMPFDVRGYRAIFYDDSIGGKKNVERNLEQHLRAILGA